MELKDVDFMHITVVKNEQDIDTPGLVLFPAASEISFTSKIFNDYVSCIRSCKSLIEDMTRDFNNQDTDERFKISAEVNPRWSGIETVSTSWEETEVAKFWVYDQTNKKEGVISAVCRSQIFAVPKDLSAEAILKHMVH